MQTQSTTPLFRHVDRWSGVTVIVPLHNYAGFIGDTLNSVLDQTLDDVSLVVVDDASTDESAAVVQRWMEQFHDRFGACLLVANDRNARLAVTRNTGAALTPSPLLFFLDADNLLYPRCLERHAAVLHARPDVAGAYSLIEIFDGEAGIMGGEVFSRDRFRYGNHVDAMAMIRRSALEAMDGYRHIQFGWEDYDLWLRMVEAGETMLQIPAVLSRYRVHGQSMLRSLTNVNNNHVELRADMVQRHPWLDLD
jgi:glycosyltransferase involved in cell wall biosynthesis